MMRVERDLENLNSLLTVKESLGMELAWPSAVVKYSCYVDLR